MAAERALLYSVEMLYNTNSNEEVEKAKPASRRRPASLITSMYSAPKQVTTFEQQQQQQQQQQVGDSSYNPSLYTVQEKEALALNYNSMSDGNNNTTNTTTSPGLAPNASSTSRITASSSLDRNTTTTNNNNSNTIAGESGMSSSQASSSSSSRRRSVETPQARRERLSNQNRNGSTATTNSTINTRGESSGFGSNSNSNITPNSNTNTTYEDVMGSLDVTKVAVSQNNIRVPLKELSEDDFDKHPFSDDEGDGTGNDSKRKVRSNKHNNRFDDEDEDEINIPINPIISHARRESVVLNKEMSSATASALALASLKRTFSSKKQNE